MYGQPLTPRERFIATLERRSLTGLTPYFVLVFFLTMEALGNVNCGLLDTGMRLARYVLMLQTWRREGVYGKVKT